MNEYRNIDNEITQGIEAFEVRMNTVPKFLHISQEDHDQLCKDMSNDSMTIDRMIDYKSLKVVIDPKLKPGEIAILPGLNFV